jgi:hypothetical protein
VTPEASDFGTDAPQMVDIAAFVVHWNKFQAPGNMCKDAAFPTIHEVDSKMEHPLKPFNILKEEDLEKVENYNNIDPIMFVVPYKFSEAWDNKAPW